MMTRAASYLRGFLAVGCLFVSTEVICVGQVAAPQTAWTDETGFRPLISKLEKPDYPKEDIRRGITGVVVSEVTLDNHGKIKGVEILQAPSVRIASAVRDAINRSTFVFPDKAYSNVSLTGKLTFYFLRANGKYLVQNPKESPQYDDLSRGELSVF